MHNIYIYIYGATPKVYRLSLIYLDLIFRLEFRLGNLQFRIQDSPRRVLGNLEYWISDPGSKISKKKPLVAPASF